MNASAGGRPLNFSYFMKYSRAGSPSFGGCKSLRYSGTFSFCPDLKTSFSISFRFSNSDKSLEQHDRFGEPYALAGLFKSLLSSLKESFDEMNSLLLAYLRFSPNRSRSRSSRHLSGEHPEVLPEL